MNHTTRLALIVLAVLPLSRDEHEPPTDAVQTETEVVDRAAARAALARMADRLDDVRVITAAYLQKRQTFLLKKPIVSKGRLLLRRAPACMLMRVEEPSRTILRSDATSHLTWPGGERPAERFVFETDRTVTTLIGCLTGDVRDLEASFTIEGFGAGEGLASIDLAPRDEKLRERMPRLTLVLALEQNLPAAIEYENRERETVRIELSGVVADPKTELEDDVFDDPLPRDVEVVTRRIGGR